MADEHSPTPLTAALEKSGVFAYRAFSHIGRFRLTPSQSLDTGFGLNEGLKYVKV